MPSAPRRRAGGGARRRRGTRTRGRSSEAPQNAAIPRGSTSRRLSGQSKIRRRAAVHFYHELFSELHVAVTARTNRVTRKTLVFGYFFCSVGSRLLYLYFPPSSRGPNTSAEVGPAEARSMRHPDSEVIFKFKIQKCDRVFTTPGARRHQSAHPRSISKLRVPSGQWAPPRASRIERARVLINGHTCTRTVKPAAN